MHATLKQKLRDEIKIKLKDEKPIDLLILSHIISGKVLNFLKSNFSSFHPQILAYWPTSYEVQIQYLLNSLVSLDYKIFLPRIISNGQMIFFKYYEENDLTTGKFGIKEPKSNMQYESSKSSVIIVPGLMFSAKNGSRIGRGKGFYDIFLADKSMLKIGICFDFQILYDVPLESHDIRMDVLLSDKKEIRFNE